MSFIEYMLFIRYFIDDKKFLDECFLLKEVIEKYFYDLGKLKLKYKDKIKINMGLEVDFIDGYENEIKDFLNIYGFKLEDSILLVYFIKVNDEYIVIDWRLGFEEVLEKFGIVEWIYDKYYEIFLKVVRVDLGEFKLKCIGYFNLIRIFNKLYFIEYKNKEFLEEIVKEIKNGDYEVDVNIVGFRKLYCNEIYVSDIFKELIEKYGVKKVYGLDLYIVSDVGRDFDKE